MWGNTIRVVLLLACVMAAAGATKQEGGVARAGPEKREGVERADPGMAKEEEEEESADPGMAKEEEEEESADPGMAKEEEEEESADPGMAKEEEAEERAVPGMAKEEEVEESADPGMAKEEEAEERAVPGQANEGEGEERAVPGSCPVCGERTCITDMTCEDGKVLVENMSVCSCCPTCVSRLGLNELCSPTFGPPCAPGLSCDPTAAKCVVQSPRSCDSFTYLNSLWKPACLEDGTYAPKQCKGETLTGRCFCTGGDGLRLFGQEWWALADNMTCACSREVWRLGQAGRTDVSLHCDLVGNYEPLQCDNGLCWCAEPLTGQPITALLPQDNMRVLPCYNATALGSQYLRQCESLLIAQARIGITMSAHGTTYPISTKTNCDPDGSYGNYQLDTYGRCYCSWKDSSALGSWAIDAASMAGVNCNCARDWRYYKDYGLELTLVCNGNGNYEPIQGSVGMYYCVDSDGFRISLPQAETPDCSEFISVP